MSLSSPRVSFDSDDPERKESGSRPNSRRIAYADDNPRKKSIQFNVGGSSGGNGGTNPPQYHHRSSSDKSPGDNKAARRSHVEFQEKDPKQSTNAASRGPSPPPPE